MFGRVRDVLLGVAGAVAGAIASIVAISRVTRQRDYYDDFDEHGAVSQTAPGEAKPAEEAQKEEPRPVPPSLPPHRPRPIPPGWSASRPLEVARPTYWPAVMSLGIAFIFWGIITSVVVSGVGLLLFAVALSGWIADLRHESEPEHGKEPE